jgi:hypothetical protein
MPIEMMDFMLGAKFEKKSPPARQKHNLGANMVAGKKPTRQLHL